MPGRIDQRKVAASEIGPVQGRRSGVARLARPGTVAMTLAVFAIILVACGGTSEENGFEASVDLLWVACRDGRGPGAQL